MSVSVLDRQIISPPLSPTENFGYSYYSHMVPPSKPAHTLMLGYGTGVVAELMRLIHGPSKITAVDYKCYQKPGAYMEYKMEVKNAWDFVRECTDSPIKKRFDYIAVDLWEGSSVPSFLYQAEFATRLREMATGKLCTNTPVDELKRLKPFDLYGFKLDRMVPVFGNVVSWWSV